MKHHTPRIKRVQGVHGKIVYTLTITRRSTDHNDRAMCIVDVGGKYVTRHLHKQDGVWWMAVCRYPNGTIEVGMVEGQP